MPDDVVLEGPSDPPSGMPTGTPPEPPAAAPPPPPDLTQPLVDPGDQPEQPEVGEEPQPGGRRTLVGELVREREQRRVAENQATAAQDLLRQVMQTPDGLSLLQRVATGAPAAEPQVDESAFRAEAEATAIDLGLYDDQGQPDLQAAARIMAREERRVQAQVERAVQQLAQTEILPLKQQRVEQTIAHVKGVAAHYGIDPEMVERGMRTLPPEQVGNAEVQQTVLMTALGLQTFGGVPQRQQGQPLPQHSPVQQGQRGQLRPPIYSEAAGGRPRSGVVLDEPFRNRLRESGLKDTEINASLERFVPGAPNRLE
jgi:hypothetical protein